MSRILGLSLVFVVVLGGRTLCLADEMEDAALVLLRSRCGAHGVIKKLPEKRGVLPRFGCDCRSSKDDCPSVSLVAVEGRFTGPQAQEFLLVVEDMDKIAHVDGWGYTVLVGKLHGVWKSIAEGKAITNASHLKTIRTRNGTDILLSYWSDCWQGCELADYKAERLSNNGRVLAFRNAGISVRFTDSAPMANKTYRTVKLTAVEVADINGDKHPDVTLKVRKESGTQDDMGKQTPETLETFELRFFFDGETFKAGPENRAMPNEEC